MNSGQAHLKDASRRSSLPKNVIFRGHGYAFINPATEPSRQLWNGGVEPMWIHEGTVSFRQKTQITDNDHFVIQLGRQAHVCDELTSSIQSERKDVGLFRIDGQGNQFTKSSSKN